MKTIIIYRYIFSIYCFLFGAFALYVVLDPQYRLQYGWDAGQIGLLIFLVFIAFSASALVFPYRNED